MLPNKIDSNINPRQQKQNLLPRENGRVPELSVIQSAP